MARVFPASQHPLIKGVLNRLIPAGGPFPGGGDVDLIDRLDEAASSPVATRRMFVEGFRHISVASERRHARGFEDLTAAEQDAVLRTVESEDRAFFEALLSHVYQTYYSHPAVIQLLGLEARPPQPLGHALPPFDAAITHSMSKRGALYRKA
jgi:hypothetical protein